MLDIFYFHIRSNLAKSSYGWLPLGLHHKIEKNNPCKANTKWPPSFLATQKQEPTKSMGNIPCLENKNEHIS